MQQFVDAIKKLFSKDGFGKFFVQYKRYFCAVVLFIILVVVLVQCSGQETADSDTNQTDTESVTESSTQTTAELTGELQKDADAELVELFQNYYSAYASADTETLEMIAYPLTDNEVSYIGTFADYYEEYQNIECYSMQAGTEDAYLVSVCYELKFYEIDTPAPGMDFFYVERNGKGNLYINNAYTSYNFNFMEQELDANIYSLIVEYEQLDEVIALQEDVQERYDEAVASDENLANLIGGTLRNAVTQWRETVTSVNEAQEAEETTEEESQETETEESDEQETETESESEDTGDSQEEEAEEASDEDTTYTVKTTDICNVRKTASTDGEILGRVDVGVKLTALGTEGDWTKVEFQGSTGYIRNDLIKTVNN